MALVFDNVKRHLDNFAFRDLFEELGWNSQRGRTTDAVEADGVLAEINPVAELGGVMVLEVRAEDGTIPDAKVRRALHKAVTERYLENLVIFVDGARKASLWVYAKRDGTKTVYRDHPFVQGQPGDLFVSKLSGIIFDVADFDEQGDVRVTEVAARLRSALDVERVTKKFYAEFQQQQLAFVELIEGIPDDRQRRWYASVLLNRLMFVYFMQRKGFVDRGERDYLQGKLAQVVKRDENYYRDFLLPLFFEGFAKPAEHRSSEARNLLGTIPYLNGGLFLEHVVERDNPDIEVPNEAFSNLLGLFSRYSWNLNDLPGADDNEINPDVLGYIFEKYINQKAFGAYYTRPEITEYLCEQTVNRLVLEAVNHPDAPGRGGRRAFETIADLLLSLDAPLCRLLLENTLPNLSLLDPACGSGAFLVAALKTLTDIYGAIIGRIEVLSDRALHDWLADVRRQHPSLSYYIKKQIITRNLYGVDIMAEATDIARLRLFLTLVASVTQVDDLEPLPNIDFNIVPGNSLIGLTQVDPGEFDRKGSDGAVQTALFASSYADIVADYTVKVEAYKNAEGYRETQAQERDAIQTLKEETNSKIDRLLLHRFWDRKIQIEEATWDDAKGKAGKPNKRAVKQSDIDALSPFHWDFEWLRQVISTEVGC